MGDQKVILVTGANGQLGMEFREIARAYPVYHFLFVTRNELDISNDEALQSFFEQYKIDYCVNCAAYTGVDKAETEKEQALQVNGHSTGMLAQFCKRYAVRFVHFSTDYVFNGLSDEPYKTDSPTDPVNYYGYTKLAGEQQALLHNPGSIIIRTSWVYSTYGKNFVKTMLQLMSQKTSLNVVNDQWGRPTYAGDLAMITMQIIDSPGWQPGIYHCSNSGTIISWFDFASSIQSISGLNCIVHPIPSEQFPTPARRPFYSALDLQKLETVFSLQPADWKISLTKCIQTLMNA